MDSLKDFMGKQLSVFKDFQKYDQTFSLSLLSQITKLSY